MKAALEVWVVSAENCHLSALHRSLSVSLHSRSRERLICLTHAQRPLSAMCADWPKGAAGRAPSFPCPSKTMCWRKGRPQRKLGFSCPRKEVNCCKEDTTDTHFTPPQHDFYQIFIQQSPCRTSCSSTRGSRTQKEMTPLKGGPGMLGGEPPSSPLGTSGCQHGPESSGRKQPYHTHTHTHE